MQLHIFSLTYFLIFTCSFFLSLLLLLFSHPYKQTCPSTPPSILQFKIAPSPAWTFSYWQASSAPTSSSASLSSSSSSLWASNDGGNSAPFPLQQPWATVTSSPTTWLPWSWSASLGVSPSFTAISWINQLHRWLGFTSSSSLQVDRLYFTSSPVWSVTWLLFTPSPTWVWDRRVWSGSETSVLGVFGCC